MANFRGSTSILFSSFCFSFLLLLSLLWGPLQANEPEDRFASPLPASQSSLITPEIRKAVKKGLKYLSLQQNQNGSIGDNFGVALTSLSGLAFMAGGSTPNQGKYKKQVHKALTFVKERARGKLGFITEQPETVSRMHGHGFASLFLAEAYGMTAGTQKELRKKIRNAVLCSEFAQTKYGGWGYFPAPEKGDEASVTITQIQALRAIQNAGFYVKPKIIDRAVDYVKKCHRGDGSFQYSLHLNRQRTTFALTAAAVSTLNYTGFYQQDRDTEEQRKIASMIQKGLNYLEEHRVDYGNRWFFYGHFYAAQAYYFSGGQEWKDWYRSISRELIQHQEEKGYWNSRFGTVYSTALSLLILQIPYQYLPIFQR